MLVCVGMQDTFLSGAPVVRHRVDLVLLVQGGEGVVGGEGYSHGNRWSPGITPRLLFSCTSLASIHTFILLYFNFLIKIVIKNTTSQCWT